MSAHGKIIGKLLNIDLSELSSEYKKIIENLEAELLALIGTNGD